jgi:hypothetical protein
LRGRARLQEYRPDGIDFLARSTDGHLDLPRAMDGGLVGPAGVSPGPMSGVGRVQWFGQTDLVAALPNGQVIHRRVLGPQEHRKQSATDRRPERYSFSNSDKSAPSKCSTTANDPARLTLSISFRLVAMRILPSARASKRFRAVSSSLVFRRALDGVVVSIKDYEHPSRSVAHSRLEGAAMTEFRRGRWRG